MSHDVRTFLAGMAAALAVAGTASAAESRGATVFAATCKACHETSPDKQNGAPQRGDVAEWKERSSVGRAEQYKRAIEGYQGYFTMPAKGGNPGLSDDDVKAAVDYLVGPAK